MNGSNGGTLTAPAAAVAADDAGPEEEMFNSKALCRLCLRTMITTMNIYQPGNHFSGYDGASVKDMVKLLFQIDIRHFLSCPEMICEMCLRELKAVIAFYNRLKKIYQLLWEVEEKHKYAVEHPKPIVPTGGWVIAVDPTKVCTSEDELSGCSDAENHDESKFSRVSKVQKHAFGSMPQTTVQPHLTPTLPAPRPTQNNVWPANTAAPAPLDNGAELMPPPPAPKGPDKKDGGVEKAYLCSFCDMAFISAKEWNRHERRYHHHATPFCCQFCPRQLKQRTELIAHIRKNHEPKRPFVCVVCGKRFCRRSDLKKHTIVHTGVRPFTCNLCKKRFSRNTNLTKHMRIHASVKPFVCIQCPRSYPTEMELQRHALTHAEEKPWKCMRCTAAFKRRDKLRLHEKSHNRRESLIDIGASKPKKRKRPKEAGQVPSSEAINADSLPPPQPAPPPPTSTLPAPPPSKPKADAKRRHYCQICHISFNRKRVFESHQALHLDRLFECSVCGANFSRSEKLQLHMKEHVPIVAPPKPSHDPGLQSSVVGLSGPTEALPLVQMRMDEECVAGHKCSICGTECVDAAAFALHCNQQHGEFMPEHFKDPAAELEGRVATKENACMPLGFYSEAASQQPSLT